MSLRENIQFYYQLDPKDYLEVLKNEYDVRNHPVQKGAFLIDDPRLPFYEPTQIEGHISVLGFNYAPLSDLLIQALAAHPDLIPDDVRISWTIEQDLIIETTMGAVREKTNSMGE
jgi:hypothetical protein